MIWGLVGCIIGLAVCAIMITALNLDEKPGGFFHAWSRRKRRTNRKRY
jgi:hypothetical protein